MRVLLAEDDKRLGNLVQRMLGQQGIMVDWVNNGDEALRSAEKGFYEVVVLDWMMPELSGLAVCKQLRDSQYQGGILMLTAKDAADDLVMGLEAGADDYLVKPFEFKELVARIRSVARRSKVALKEDIIRAADLEINQLTKTAKRGNRKIQLSAREYMLLQILVENYGRVLPREILLYRVWGWETEVSPNNLDAFIKLLRKKIEHPGEGQLIHNIRGIGYKLEARDDSETS